MQNDDYPKVLAFGPLMKTRSDYQDLCVEKPCSFCEEEIQPDDSGFLIPAYGIDPNEAFLYEGHTYTPYHRECFLRTIVGSVAHQRHQCSCHGGTGEDDPKLTKRQAAKAAVREFDKRYWLTNYLGKGAAPASDKFVTDAVLGEPVKEDPNEERWRQTFDTTSMSPHYREEKKEEKKEAKESASHDSNDNDEPDEFFTIPRSQ